MVFLANNITSYIPLYCNVVYLSTWVYNIMCVSIASSWKERISTPLSLRMRRTGRHS